MYFVISRLKKKEFRDVIRQFINCLYESKQLGYLPSKKFTPLPLACNLSVRGMYR